MRIYRRTRSAFRFHNNPPAAVASAVQRTPAKMEPGCRNHWIFGSDNPNSTCMRTGKRAHANLRGYMKDAGSGYTTAPVATLPNGAVGECMLLPTTGVWSFTIGSGGTGYPTASQCTVDVSGGTYAPGGKAPRFKVISVSAGVVVSVSMLDPGSGILTMPTVTIVGAGGSGGFINVVQVQGVRRIIVDTPGTNFTGAPTVNVSGGVAGTNLPARAFAVLSGNTVAAIYLWDTGYGYNAVPSVTVTGGGGSGCTAHAEIGTLLVRALVLKEPGSQGTGFDAVLTGGNGTGALASALMSNGVYSLTTNSIICPAGGTTDVNGQHGLVLPMMDEGEFTLSVVVKITNAATSQVVFGTATNAGNTRGGMEVRYTSASQYQFQDFNLQLTLATLPMPAGATNGTWVQIIYRVKPVAGAFVKPSAANVQSYQMAIRAGLASAIAIASGERKLVTQPRMIVIGNGYEHSVTFRASVEFAEAILWDRYLSDDEATAVRVRRKAVLADRSVTLVE